MRKFLIFGVATLLLFAPLLVFADSHSLVPEKFLSEDFKPQDVKACDLMRLVNNLIQFAVQVAVMISAIMFAYAGFLYVTASASPSNLDKAKKLFGYVFLGLVVILVAWIVIDLVLTVFTGKGFGDRTIPCVETITEPQGEATMDDSALMTGADECADCVVMNPSIPQKDDLGGRVDAELNEKLVAADLTSMGLRVTENYPPSREHTAPCHYTGTCVDVNRVDRNDPITGSEIADTVSQFDEANLRAVYEVRTPERETELESQGAPASSVIVVEDITAEHYSLYCDDCSD